ncbi:hypothetical protein [Pedobacter aquatilis]|uniref:hypothetical protein n=1 Tax=Pedobacter aquatilis TaxID=351343 RepID=UPI00292E64F9|nr:hypothetical protein [Pedobacter aquatilis]
MRKVLAILCTIITLGALRETFRIFTSNEADIVAARQQLIPLAVSITVPLIILSLWLWVSKPRKEENN